MAARVDAATVYEFCRNFNGPLSSAALNRVRHRVRDGERVVALANMVHPQDLASVARVLVEAHASDLGPLQGPLCAQRTENAESLWLSVLAASLADSATTTEHVGSHMVQVAALPPESLAGFWRAAAKLERSPPLRIAWASTRNATQEPLRSIVDAGWGEESSKVALCELPANPSADRLDSGYWLRLVLEFPAAFARCERRILAYVGSREAVEFPPGVRLPWMSEAWAARIALLRVRRASIGPWSSVSEMLAALREGLPMSVDAMEFARGASACGGQGVCEMGGDVESAWFVAEAVDAVRSIDGPMVAGVARALRVGGLEVSRRIRAAIGGPLSAKWQSVLSMLAGNGLGEADRVALIELLVQSGDASGESRAHTAAAIVAALPASGLDVGGVIARVPSPVPVL